MKDLEEYSTKAVHIGAHVRRPEPFAKHVFGSRIGRAEPPDTRGAVAVSADRSQIRTTAVRARHHEHFVRRWCDEDVSGMQIEVKKPIQMEKGDSLARVPKVADELGKRHAGSVVFAIAQSLDVRRLDVQAL